MSSTLVNFVPSIIHKILRILEKFLYITNPHKYQQSEKSNPNCASISKDKGFRVLGWGFRNSGERQHLIDETQDDSCRNGKEKGSVKSLETSIGPCYGWSKSGRF